MRATFKTRNNCSSLENGDLNPINGAKSLRENQMSQLAEFIGNHIFYSLAFMAVLFLFIMLTMSEKMQAFANISSAQLTQMVNHQNAVVIDTRSEADYANGHIVNAINMPLPELFKTQTKKRQHLSVVKDEFGAVVGLVTMEDLFETLLGQEILDESDKVIDLQEYARQKFEDENN